MRLTGVPGLPIGMGRRRAAKLGAGGAAVNAGVGSAAVRQGSVAPVNLWRRLARGAAGVWWPIRSSKPAGPGSPRVGRFDSFAAPWAVLQVLCGFSADLTARQFCLRMVSV